MLEVQLLGRLHIECDGQPMGLPSTRRARSLLGFLILHKGRRFRRGALIEAAWGERVSGRTKKWLRTELWRIRSLLEGSPESSAACFVVDRKEIAFDPDQELWIDYEEFQRRFDRVSRQASEVSLSPAELDAELLGAVDLYRGDLLEGFDDEWVLDERNRLLLRFLSVLTMLMRTQMQRGDWDGAIRSGQRLLREDPLLEAVHRDLMVCFLRQGNRPAAIRQFERCSRTLRRNLTIEPMPETVDLYRRISAGDPIAPITGSVDPVDPVGGSDPGEAQLADLVLGVRRLSEHVSALRDELRRLEERLRRLE
jgi:DNA-binding SARP family transcriptional activator